MNFYSGGFLYHKPSKEILLHFRDSMTQNNPHTWAFFGGLSEGDETPEQTFTREIFEELRFTPSQVIALRDYFNSDFSTHRYVYFVSVESKPPLQLYEGETADWFLLEQVFNLSLSKRTREDLLYFQSHVLRTS